MEKKPMRRFWDWVDRRDVDKHIVCLFTLFLTYTITKWAMAFAATQADKPGLEIAAIIGAVTAPYMALQGAVIRFYFSSRPTDMVNPASDPQPGQRGPHE